MAALELRDEDLAVATLPVRAAPTMALDHLVHEAVLDGDLDAGLGHEVHDVFRAAIQLGVAALPPEALDLRHRHAGNAEFDSAARTSSSLKG